MENKPKILIFSLAYTPFIGGAEIAVQEITKRLISNFDFEIITCNLDGQQKNEEQIDGVKVYRVGKGKLGKYFFSWLAYKKAVELHLCHSRESGNPEKNNSGSPIRSGMTKNSGYYDAIWSIMANRAGLAALKFKEKFSNVKYLLTLQEGDTMSHIYKRTWFWYWYYKKIYQKADHIQVISKWLENRARKFGYNKEISVIPNGVNFYCHAELVSASQETLKLFISTGRQVQGDKNKEKIILTVSRLVKKNGVADLIKAFKLLITHYLPRRQAGSLLITKLIIIGSGPLENRLKKLVQELGVANKIEFLGQQNYEETQKYYQQADVFCRPSLSEGFGNVFIEAMANKIPVIATPVGGIPDFLTDGVTGWFCEPKNPKSIAEKIAYVLDEKNKEEVEQVVANARKMVEKKYDWNIIAEKMKEIFNKLI